MNDTLTKLRIFVASPSDMATERGKVESVAVMLKPLADTLGIVIDIMDWRVVVPDMGRPEQVILDQLKPTAWDVLVGILWHRFGTPSGKEFQSGTEEEFVAAYRLWKQYGKPRIMMYRCNRPAPLDALDPDQFKLVKEFFAEFDALKGERSWVISILRYVPRIRAVIARQSPTVVARIWRTDSRQAHRARGRAILCTEDSRRTSHVRAAFFRSRGRAGLSDARA